MDDIAQKMVTIRQDSSAEKFCTATKLKILHQT